MGRKPKTVEADNGEKPFNAEEFVKVWQTSDSVKDAADKLAIEPHNASSRAMFFRKKGVPLKNMPRHRGPGYDYEALKALAKSSLNG